MQIHKFLINNPCKACEYHIASGIRSFAIFDLVFQAVFIIPVFLQFKIYNSNEHALKDDAETNCRAEKAHLAIMYSMTDLLNLGLGIVSDIFIYIGAKQSNTLLAKVCTWFFLGVSVLREALHIAGMSLHMIRCMPKSYAYEIVVRLLGQYLVYGFWIAGEFLLWLNKGCQFVPRRGLMEPPVELMQVTAEEISTLVAIALSGDSQFRNISGIPSAEETLHKVVDQPVKIEEVKKQEVFQPKRKSRKSLKAEKKIGKGAGEGEGPQNTDSSDPKQ